VFGGRIDSSGNIKTEYDRRIWKNPYPLQATFWSRIDYPQKKFVEKRSNGVSVVPVDASKSVFRDSPTADEPTLYADNTHISIARNLNNNPFQLSGYNKDQWINTMDEAFFYKQRIKSCREWKLTRGRDATVSPNIDNSANNFLVKDKHNKWVREKSNNYTTPVVRLTILKETPSQTYTTTSEIQTGDILRQFYFTTNTTNMGKIKFKFTEGLGIS
jgi:hypothetical protein